jgi:hypothetical protein
MVNVEIGGAAKYKEQSSKIREGIAGGDGIVGFRVESIE